MKQDLSKVWRIVATTTYHDGREETKYYGPYPTKALAASVMNGSVVGYAVRAHVESATLSEWRN